MGATRPNWPNPFTPVSAAKAKGVIADAVLARIDADQLEAAQIALRYPSIRKGDLTTLRAGDHALFGLNRLMALAEAVGVRVSVTAA